jgi:hypothetical protein
MRIRMKILIGAPRWDILFPIESSGKVLWVRIFCYYLMWLEFMLTMIQILNKIHHSLQS